MSRLWRWGGILFCASICQVYLRPQGSQQELRGATEWVSKPGEHWCGAVECGQDERLCCTILIQWEVGYDERWVIVTALPPEESQGAWYSMRFWIEGSENRSEAWRVAMAPHENARPEASGPTLGSHGSGHALGGGGWRKR